MNALESLCKKDCDAVVSIASIIHVKRNEIILSKGDKSDKEYFVEGGIVRGFIVDDEGNEKSTAFFQDGEFMSMASLRTRDGACLYNYQALCPTKLMVFDPKQLRELFSVSEKFMEIGKEVRERELTRIYNRDECLMQVKAADKYQKFIQFYPNIEKYISQRYIASYLGITPVSLSRLKKSMVV
jgi:CRP-like cAMP-binding protein